MGVTTIAVPGTGVVALSKSVTQPIVQPGQEFGYRLVADCSSLTAACLDATITDTLPAGFDVTSVPGSTSERTVTYDAATRLLTVVYTIPLPSPPNPAGSTGIPAGQSRQIDIGLRLPTETAFVDGTTVTNTASLAASNTNSDQASVDITVQIPENPVPVATKSWADGSAIAQSGEATTVTLGVRNASSTSTPVTSVTVTDLDADTFDRFDVTRLNLTQFPAGADQVLVSVCTILNSGCSATDSTGWTTATTPATSTGPLTLPGGVSLDDITGVRLTFSNAAGTVLPYDATGGRVDLGLQLRDTLRSTGADLAPTVTQTVQNCAVPTLVAGATTTGSQACANFAIVPNIATVTAGKTFFSDTDGNFTADGTAIVGADSPVSMVINGRNTSPFAVATLSISEPSTVTSNEFDKVDISGFRLTLPSGAQRAIVTVTCRSGADPAPQTFTGNVNTTQPTGCADGVGVASISVRFEGTSGDGVGTVASNAIGYLRLHGNLNDLVTSADVGSGNGVRNCATADVTNPVDGSGAGTADACATLAVQNPTVGGVGTKGTANITTIVPGQPLTYYVTMRNSGNIGLTDVVYLDPPDPSATGNAFDVVRLTNVRVTNAAGVTYVIEVWDPDVAGYVVYNAADTALLDRAHGMRIRLTEPLSPGLTFSANYDVVLRDDASGQTIRNCASMSATGLTTGNFCANTVTSQPATTSGSIQKLFAPTTLVRPVAGLTGQTSQLQVRIQNGGPLYLDQLIVTDTDADFFDAVDWVGPVVANAPPGANRARLEVCTTGCASGTFIAGGLVTVANNTTLNLPAGVDAADVRGFRVTFTRADGAYLLTPRSNFPSSGRCQGASVCVTIRPRVELRSEPGTPIPDTLANTASGAGSSVNQEPGTTFPIGDTEATITLTPGVASMDIDKGPQSRIAPGEVAPLSLNIENTGTALIPNLVVVDPIPDGIDLDQNFAGGAPGEPFLVTYTLPAGVDPPTDVVFEAVPDPADANRVGTVRWSFPGWEFPPGAQVRIDLQVRLEPGTPANTVITNVTGVSSSAPFTCTPDAANDSSVTDDPAFGSGLFCTSSTTITALQGTAFSSAKWVSGDESLGFVYTLDPSRPRVALDDPRCPRLQLEGETYTRYPCAAMVLAGNSFEFLLRLTNESNEAFAEQITMVDRLPEIGDTGVILTGESRGTEWSPRPLLASNVRLIGGGVLVSTGYTTSGSPCLDDLDPAPPGCPAGAFGPFSPDARAFQTIVDFSGGGGLAPGASYGIHFSMDAPPDLDDPSTVPIAWNSFAHTSWLVVQGGDDVVLGPTEPIKAGIAIPFGQVRVSKAEVDPPPGVTLPPYLVSYTCSVGTTVVAADDDVEVTGGGAFLLPLVPVGAECRIWETFTSGAVPDTDPDNVRTITVEDFTTAEDPQDVLLTNTFPQGALEIAKVVEGDGVGLPLVPDGASGDGPFTVNVDCRFPADGGASLTGFPRDIVLDAGQTETISPLPVGTACTVAETDDAGAYQPAVVPRSTPPASATVIITDADPETVEIDPNGVDVRNPFPTTPLRITKTVEGEGSDYADRDFTFSVECVQASRAFAPITATIDRPDETEVVVDGLPVGALCAVYETDGGGADEPTPRLVGIVQTTTPGDGEPTVEVDATNTFSAGRITLAKVIEGPGGGVATDFEFVLDVTCERPGDGDTFVPLLSRSVTVTADEPVVLDDLLPIGSRCWATESDDEGATEVSIDHDSVENAAIVTLDAPVIAITATNTYDVGDLVIDKVIEGPGAVWADRPFTFDVDCMLDDHPQPTVTVSITPPETSVTVPGLSTGASCTVTEVDSGGADAPATIDPSPVVIGGLEDAAVHVTATNTFSVGNVEIAKVLDGAAAEFAADRTFTVEVVCQRPTSDDWMEVLRDTVIVAADSPVTVDGDLPIGSRCWATETDSNGAASSGVDFDSADNAAIVTVDAPTITITATNTFTLGALEIVKTLAGPGALQATGPFVFSVDCTFGGEALPTQTVTISLPDVAATVEGLPSGATCVVAETDAGDADGPNTISPEQVTIGAPDADPVRVEAVNFFDPATTTTLIGPAQVEDEELPPTGNSPLGPRLAFAFAFLFAGSSMLLLVALTRRRRC